MEAGGIWYLGLVVVVFVVFMATLAYVSSTEAKSRGE